jgi:cell division protein FtsA
MPEVIEREQERHGLAKTKEELLDVKSLGVTEEIQKISKKAVVDSIIRPRVREIFELVGKEVKKSGFGAQTPSGLVICGGGSLTVGVLDQAKYILGYPARLGKVEGLSGMVDEIDSPVFATAAGLIIYGAKNDVNSQFSLPVLAKGLPIKEMMQRGINLVKSFLP